MSDVMLDVLSVLDSNEEPIYSNCTLQLGELKLEFKNGRSKIPLSKAAEVLRNPNCLVPGYDGPAAPAVPNEAAELTVRDDVRQQLQETPEQREARITAAEEYLRGEGLHIPPRPVEPVSSAREAELEQRIAALEGLLAQSVPLADLTEPDAAQAVDGPEDDDEPDDAPEGDADEVPDGIEALTADGKPRCWARKGDGSQCANGSVDGSHACGLAAHQKLVK